MMHKRLILTHGEQVIHYTGQLCSCSPDGLPESADLNCVKCQGLGVFWREPRSITAIITGLDSDRTSRQWLQNGIALPEDMSCSPLPGLSRRFKDYDKIIPTWKRGFPYPGELLRRGRKDTLLYRPVGKIVRVSKVNPEVGTEEVWIEGVDFSVGGTDNKSVLWVNGRGPGFEFVCWAPPAPRWERGKDLGQRVLLRKMHLPWPTSNWA